LGEKNGSLPPKDPPKPKRAKLNLWTPPKTPGGGEIKISPKVLNPQPTFKKFSPNFTQAQGKPPFGLAPQKKVSGTPVFPIPKVFKGNLGTPKVFSRKFPNSKKLRETLVPPQKVKNSRVEEKKFGKERKKFTRKGKSLKSPLAPAQVWN